MTNISLPEQVANELAVAIKSNYFVEELYLCNNNLGSSISVIAKACSQNSSLKQLHIANTSILGVCELPGVIGCNSSIEILSISDNNLQSSSFLFIAQALKAVLTLKCLYANSINITSAVSEELSCIIDHNASLTELSFNNNLLQNGLIQIAESCMKLNCLKCLELSHNCINPTQVIYLSSIIDKYNSLESLSLGGISLSITESLFLTVYRFYHKQIGKDTSDILTSREVFCNNILLTCYEFLRIKICQTSSLSYKCLHFVYNHWCICISNELKRALFQTIINSEFVVQKAKQTLLQIDSKAMMSSLQIVRRLKVINLENNNIDEDAAKQLAGHLHCNNILELLWLRGNELCNRSFSCFTIITQPHYTTSQHY